MNVPAAYRAAGLAVLLALAMSPAQAACVGELPQPNGPVHAMTTDSTAGTLYIAGDFTMVGAELRDNLAAISLETCEVTGWEPTANGEVRAMWLSADDELMYVGGDFTEIAGQNYGRLAAVRTAEPGEIFAGWDPPDANARVHAIIPSEGGQTFYIGGAFTAIGSAERHGFVELSRSIGGVTGARITLDEGAVIETLALGDDRLYIGGDFTTIRVGDEDIGFEDRSRAAAIDVSSRELADWAPDIEADAVHVLRLAPDGNTVHAGTSSGAGAFDPDSGEAVASWQPQINGAVHALQPSFDRSLWYVGGDFDEVNGVSRDNLAALRAVDGTLVDEVFVTGGASIRSLQRTEDIETGDYRLYAGGTENDGVNGYLAGFEVAAPEQDPPLTTATPAGSDGPFNSDTIEPITLTCNDFGGSGCAETRFTIDGSEPGPDSILYSAPINLLASMTVRFFSIDQVGNREPTRTEVYEVETTPPSTFASPGSRVFEERELRVTLTCSDSGSGCAATYYTTDGSRPTTSSRVYEGPIVISATTVLRFFSVDVAGNAEGVQREEYVRNRGEVGAFSFFELMLLLSGWWWHRWRRA